MQQHLIFPTTDPSTLTSAYNLGHGLVGKLIPNYNDIDDFHGFTKSVSAPHAEGYQITCVCSVR